MNLNSELATFPWRQVLSQSNNFVNPLTGTVWQLSVEKDIISIDVPNYNFKISPISSNKFKPLSPTIKLEFEFEQPDHSKSCVMHIYAKGIKRASFEAVY